MPNLGQGIQICSDPSGTKTRMARRVHGNICEILATICIHVVVEYSWFYQQGDVNIRELGKLKGMSWRVF